MTFFLPFSFLAFCFSIVSRLFSYYLNNKKKGGGLLTFLWIRELQALHVYKGCNFDIIHGYSLPHNKTLGNIFRFLKQ